jgi:hypothetical protein
MKEELRQQSEAIISLLESWVPENATLAIEIMKGNPKLKAIVAKHYGPMFKVLFGRMAFKNFVNMPERVCKLVLNSKQLPYYPFLESIMPLLPIYYLYLNCMELKEIPWWIFKMPQLIELDLSENFITEIPKEIAHLINLENLNLNRNKLKNLPENIGLLNKLERLQLDFNKIEKLPESVGDLEKLQWLCLEANNITALPKSCSQLKNLYWLSIEKTPLGKKNKINKGMYISVQNDSFKKLLES